MAFPYFELARPPPVLTSLVLQITILQQKFLTDFAQDVIDNRAAIIIAAPAVAVGHPGPEPETTGAADMEIASSTQTASHEEPTSTDERMDSTTGSSPPPTDSPSQAPVRDCTDA